MTHPAVGDPDCRFAAGMLVQAIGQQWTHAILKQAGPAWYVYLSTSMLQCAQGGRRARGDCWEGCADSAYAQQPRWGIHARWCRDTRGNFLGSIEEARQAPTRLCQMSNTAIWSKVASHTCVIEVCLIVPLMPGLQHDLTALSHAAHVHALILAARCLAQQLELADERNHIDEGIIIGLENVSHIIVGDCIFQDKVGLPEDALIISLVVEEDDVSIGVDFLGNLQSPVWSCIRPYIQIASFLQVSGLLCDVIGTCSHLWRALVFTQNEASCRYAWHLGLICPGLSNSKSSVPVASA